jgi:hypothetical protein
MDDRAKRLADIVIASLQLLAVIAGGIWVFFRFRREGSHTPKVEFDIEGKFFGPQCDWYLAEFVMSVKNKGLVRHKFTVITLRVRGIQSATPVTIWGDTQRVEFPERIVGDANVMHKPKYNSIFVEPGVTQRVTFVARIPAGIRFVVARAEFEYDTGRTHSAERVFETSVRDPGAQ